MKLTKIFFVLLLGFLFFPLPPLHAETSPTFFNPVLPSGADPTIVFKDGYYYYTHTTARDITLLKSETISGLAKASPVTVWTPPATGPQCCNIWAPELYYSESNGKWYIYFAADNGNSYDNHRMYVLESVTSDPMGAYVNKGKIYDTANDRFAIDGAVLKKPDGSIYFVWSGKDRADNESSQRLYIAAMSNPWTISGRRVMISRPTYSWEQPYNEGPQPLVRNGKIFIAYAANASYSDNYATGLLTNTNGNVLSASSWSKKSSPIFSKTSDVFGPGHGSFTKSPDGTEDWHVYHAARFSGAGWDRNIRAQKFTWNTDGTPNLGRPVSAGLSLPLPSGERLDCDTCYPGHGWGSSITGTKVIGDYWNHISSPSAVFATNLGAMKPQLFLRENALSNYTVSTDVRWITTGTSSSSPKYGIYAAYKDNRNYVQVFIDKKNRYLRTSAVVNGSTQSTQNTTISLDYAQPHNLKVVKNGTTFSFYLDNALKQTRNFSISNGQVGIVTEDTQADYKNFTVSAL